jgi:hypothetical protein
MAFLIKLILFIATYFYMGIFYLVLSTLGYGNYAAIGLVVYAGTLHIIIFNYVLREERNIGCPSCSSWNSGD